MYTLRIIRFFVGINYGLIILFYNEPTHRKLIAIYSHAKGSISEINNVWKEVRVTREKKGYAKEKMDGGYFGKYEDM